MFANISGYQPWIEQDDDWL